MYNNYTLNFYRRIIYVKFFNLKKLKKLIIIVII